MKPFKAEMDGEGLRRRYQLALERLLVMTGHTKPHPVDNLRCPKCVINGALGLEQWPGKDDA